MLFKKIEISTNLDSHTIRHLLQLHTHPVNTEWNVKEFNIKNPVEKTYSCVIKKNNFKLRARKTNQRRQSRPIGYGEILQRKKNTLIRIEVYPHIGSIIFWFFTFFFTFGTMVGAIMTLNPIHFIPGILIFSFACLFYILNLKYDAQDMELFMQKILKQNSD